MNGITRVSIGVTACVLLTAATAFAQIELTGTYTGRMYEDYIERGPGSDLGDFTGTPLSDEGRARALLFTPNVLSMIERQCLPGSPWSGAYLPGGVRIVSELDAGYRVIAWKIRGSAGNGQGAITIWMDGRPRPSPNSLYDAGGFTTGKWEGDTLTAVTTNLKAAWLRRGNGIPMSDQAKITAHITRDDDLLTITTIVEDPVYLTEPHVVSRVSQFDPRADQGARPFAQETCNSATEVPRLEDSGIVPHYLPGGNPEANFMTRTYNIPPEAAMGHAETLYPEYRKKLRTVYTLPKTCDRYCCGWIERAGLPGGAPNLTCNDGGFPRTSPAR